VFWADKLQLHQCKHHSVAQITIWAKQIHLQKPDQVCISILQLSLIRQHLHTLDGWIELQCSSCFNLGVFLSCFAAKVLGVLFCTLLRSRVMPVQQGALHSWTESGAWGLGFGRSRVWVQQGIIPELRVEPKVQGLLLVHMVSLTCPFTPSSSGLVQVLGRLLILT
jgi:hypothetical protein